MKKTLIAFAGIALSASAALAADGTVPFGGSFPAVVPDNSAGGVTRSTAAISGTFAFLSTVAFDMSWNPGHTWVGDIDIVLTYTASNGSASARIMSSTGATTDGGVGDNDNLGVGLVYLFADGGADFEGATTNSTSHIVPAGTYAAFQRGATGNGGALIVNSLNTIFGGAGLLADGTFSVNVSDHASADTGSLSAMNIRFTSIPTPGAAALLGLGGLVSLRRRR